MSCLSCLVIPLVLLLFCLMVNSIVLIGLLVGFLLGVFLLMVMFRVLLLSLLVSSLTFQNLVFERLAEPVCMDSFAVNSHNSVTCHPSMHAPSLTRAFVGGSCGIAVFGGLVVSGTARMDESLHDGIHSVSAYSNSSFKGFSDYHGSPCARWNAFPIQVRSVVMTFREKQSVQGRVLCAR